MRQTYLVISSGTIREEEDSLGRKVNLRRKEEAAEERAERHAACYREGQIEVLTAALQAVDAAEETWRERHGVTPETEDGEEEEEEEEGEVEEEEEVEEKEEQEWREDWEEEEKGRSRFFNRKRDGRGEGRMWERMPRGGEAKERINTEKRNADE